MRYYYNVRNRNVASVYLIICLVVSLLPARLTFADVNQLYISPDYQQLKVNEQYTVTVGSYTDTDEASGNANGTVTYSSSLLSVVSTSTGGSNYGIPSVIKEPGKIRFNATRSPAPSGIAKIFSITFKAKKSGTATIGFSNGNVNGVPLSGGNVKPGTCKITDPNPPKSSNPPPASSPAPVITPPPTPKPTPTQLPATNPEPQPTPDPTGVVDNVVVEPTYTSSTITWRVNAPKATSTMLYGSSYSTLDKKATVSKKPDGSFGATIQGLEPGVRYYFAIMGKGGENKSGSYNGTIITNGFPVVITVTENDIAASNALVKIGSISRVASTDGKASLGLAAGEYSGTITTDTATMTINFTVVKKSVPEDGTAPPSQTFSYNLTSSPLEQGPGSGFSILAFIGVLIGGTVVLGLGFIGFMAYRRRRFEEGFAPHTSGKTVIIDDGYDWQRTHPPVSSRQQQPPSPEEVKPVNSVHINDTEPPDMFDQAEHKKPDS